MNCVCEVKTAKNHLDIQHRLGLGKGRKGKYAEIGSIIIIRWLVILKSSKDAVQLTDQEKAFFVTALPQQ